jgi:hypothetical protein
LTGFGGLRNEAGGFVLTGVGRRCTVALTGFGGLRNEAGGFVLTGVGCEGRLTTDRGCADLAGGWRVTVDLEGTDRDGDGRAIGRCTERLALLGLGAGRLTAGRGVAGLRVGGRETEGREAGGLDEGAGVDLAVGRREADGDLDADLDGDLDGGLL